MVVSTLQPFWFIIIFPFKVFQDQRLGCLLLHLPVVHHGVHPPHREQGYPGGHGWGVWDISLETRGGLFYRSHEVSYPAAFWFQFHLSSFVKDLERGHIELHHLLLQHDGAQVVQGVLDGHETFLFLGFCAVQISDVRRAWQRIILFCLFFKYIFLVKLWWQTNVCRSPRSSGCWACRWLGGA